MSRNFGLYAGHYEMIHCRESGLHSHSFKKKKGVDSGRQLNYQFLILSGLILCLVRIGII